MIYFIVTLAIVVIVLGIVCLLTKRTSEPTVYDEKTLISYLNNSNRRGQDISARSIKRLLKRQYKISLVKLKEGRELFSFEKWLTDNHYKILSICDLVEKTDFGRLPHYQNVPRIVLLTRYAVSRGYDKSVDSLIDFLKDVQKRTDLDYEELSNYRSAICFCELEKITQCAVKSINLWKTERKSDGDNEIKDTNCEYLFFYQKKHSVGEHYGEAMRNARFEVEQELIGLELSVRKSLDIIEKSASTIGRTILPFYSYIDQNFCKLHDYDKVSVNTRCSYMKKICELSDKYNVPESVVADSCIYLSSLLKKDVSEILFDNKTLKTYVKRGKVKEYGKSFKKHFFVISVILLSMLSFIPLYFTCDIYTAFFVPMLFIIVLKPIEFLLKRLVSFCKKPPVFACGYKELPESAKTMVVVSQYVNSLEKLKSALANLETLSFNCTDKMIKYILLVDLPKSDKNNEKEEKRILDYSKKLKITDDRICLLVRKRINVNGEFVAYERKRGAILDLFEAVINKDFGKFEIVNGNTGNPKFAILLDDDSALLPNTILNAVNTIIHPYNAKYDLMTFSTKINKHSITTEYSLRYSEDGSIDCYPCYSDVYSDVFDDGLYCGKGIVRINSYYEKLKDLFPDNRILSHDLIEGAFLKTGSLKLSVYEDAPTSFKSDSERTERWQKGDVLLLPYLSPIVKNKKGERIINRISPIYKLIILINATAGLRDFFFLLSVFLGIVSQRTYFVYTVVILLVAPYFFASIGSLSQIFKKVRLRYVLRDFFKTAAHCLERIFFLPFYAFAGLKVYFSTTYKSLFVKNKPIEWKPFFASQTKSRFFAYSKLFLPSKMLTSILAIISGNAYFIGYAGFFVIYAFIVYKGKTITPKTDYEERKTIEDVAKKTYNYFEKATLNGLPIDNVQDYPIVKQTIMTSPTDIGFALLNEIAGVELGITTKESAKAKTIKILSSLISLKRYKGHFYNWYNAETKEPMYPYNISTADSANMTACLYCLSAYAKRNEDKDVIKLVNRLIEIDYSFLFDESRGLMYISYYPDENRGEGHYDIFESEARLAYYIAICLGQSVDSWFNLSRRFISYGGNTAISWYGSSFEYMMPTIFLNSPLFTMQELTEKNACKLQSRQRYKGCFGISESAIREVNEDFRYKYRPNGIEELKERFESDEYVYSPYSATLCLKYSNGEVGECLNNYVKNGLLTSTGFYDSFTAEGLVFMQMTHHQGMIMCQIANKLKDNLFCNLFMENPIMFSGRILLCEPYHRLLPISNDLKKIVVSKQEKTVVGFDKNYNQFGVLIGNDYSVGYSQSGSNRTVTNHADVTPFYAKEFEGKNTFVKSDDDENYLSIYASDSVGYFCEDYISFYNKKLNVCETIKLLPDGKGEIRRLTFENFDKRYKVSHYFDVCLRSQNELYSHKAFFDLFVKTQIIDDCALFWVENKIAIGVKILGLCNYKIDSNKLNVKDRNKNYLHDFDDSYIKQGSVIYPCYAVNGEFTPDRTENNVYIVQVVANDRQEVMRQLDKYSYKTVDEAYDLYSYSENKLYIDNAVLDFVGSVIYSSYSQNELKKSIVPDVNVVRYDGFGDSSWQKFETACKMLRAIDVPLVLSIDKRAENEQIVSQISKLDVRVRTDEIAVKVRWGEKTLSDKKLRSGILNKPNIRFNGYKIGEGKFVENGYVVLPWKNVTKKPYSNVLSSEKCGCLVTDNGVSFSWLDNSRERKITWWRNDERNDRPSEDVVLWIDNRLFSLASCVNSICMHKLNESIFYTNYENLKFTVEIYVAENEKSIVKKVKVSGSSEKKFAIGFTFDLSLNWKPNGYIYAERLDKEKTCYINKASKMRCAFECKGGQSFGGKNGLYNLLKNQTVSYDNNDFVGFVCRFDGLNDKKEIYCAVGTGTKNYDPVAIDRGAVAIKTNRISLDLLFNGWLLKQVRDCRFFARTSFYQCGGAYGFRDQLQDCIALLYSYPERVKDHILLCASRQYEEGDVMHWWHMPKTGVRTKNGDDRLFLCYLVAKYYNRTGDKSILNRQLPFLNSEPLKENELSRFETPSVVKQSATLLEHMKRAIDSAMCFGENSLLLTGSGDWNDGLDKIGVKGRGESVWLSMFAFRVLSDCVEFFEGNEKIKIVKYLDKLRTGINNAFVIDRFIAYVTDDGEVLGKQSSKKCSLYLPVQAFSVLSGAVEPSLYNVALDTAMQLVDYTNGIVKIFDKPFDDADNYGYICSYPKGVRENGGQYTHASVWFVKALFLANRIEDAYELLCMINPIEKSLSHNYDDYSGEPYVLSADVYDGDYKGRAGWTWYTGSASWYYETVVETMFGLKFVGGRLYFEPKLPKEANGSELRLKLDGTTYIMKFNRSDKNEIVVNGIVITENSLFIEKNKGIVFVTVNYKNSFSA